MALSEVKYQLQLTSTVPTVSKAAATALSTNDAACLRLEEMETSMGEEDLQKARVLSSWLHPHLNEPCCCLGAVPCPSHAVLPRNSQCLFNVLCRH